MDVNSGPLPGTDAEALLASVASLLRAKGERMTTPRRAVLTALAHTSGHLTMDEVGAAVADIAPQVHRASVYRTLVALSDLGVVQHVHLGHGATAYHLTGSEGPHLHAQCRRCGRIQDLPTDLLSEVARRMGTVHDFELDATHVALSGLCADCTTADRSELLEKHGHPSHIATHLH
ncbi:Fur family transcriptional regulator [Propionicimonas sp.]|uniref:Fur family transcriptional regulator n=1 Tax=Propionicimonas sp. TaxID=1955623 RepID=UPI0025FE0EF3|nr:Fur family transcriptional regulator [Propionicimonas sp.]MCG2805103.1 transcriptional repressor [Propionicimonas sp.]